MAWPQAHRQPETHVGFRAPSAGAPAAASCSKGAGGAHTPLSWQLLPRPLGSSQHGSCPSSDGATRQLLRPLPSASSLCVSPSPVSPGYVSDCVRLHVPAPWHSVCSDPTRKGRAPIGSRPRGLSSQPRGSTGPRRSSSPGLRADVSGSFTRRAGSGIAVPRPRTGAALQPPAHVSPTSHG